jgi:hypothetical protein
LLTYTDIYDYLLKYPIIPRFLKISFSSLGKYPKRGQNRPFLIFQAHFQRTFEDIKEHKKALRVAIEVLSGDMQKFRLHIFARDHFLATKVTPDFARRSFSHINNVKTIAPYRRSLLRKRHLRDLKPSGFAINPQVISIIKFSS